MTKNNQNGMEQNGSEEELIGVLMAISVTSKHLANELIHSSHEETEVKGGKHGKHLKNGRSHQKTEKRSSRN